MQMAVLRQQPELGDCSDEELVVLARQGGENAIRALIKRIHDKAPQVPIIVFPRGAGTNYARYASETGAIAISLDAHTSLSLAKEFPANIVSQGNLDPLALIAGGKALQTAVEDIKHLTKGRPHVFNLGHGIRPETPVEHVAQLVELIRGRAA